jgi:hypothetical protein
MGVWGADEQPRVLGPATGPIAVAGASPGDTLKGDILAIKPGAAAMHDVRVAWDTGRGTPQMVNFSYKKTCSRPLLRDNGGARAETSGDTTSDNRPRFRSNIPVGPGCSCI